MLKPKHLTPGDSAAVVSLSAGTLGEPWAIHKLHIARERLERDYGLKVITMPNALRGREYLYRHPEARAADLMEAFQNQVSAGRGPHDPHSAGAGNRLKEVSYENHRGYSA